MPISAQFFPHLNRKWLSYWRVRERERERERETEREREKSEKRKTNRAEKKACKKKKTMIGSSVMRNMCYFHRSRRKTSLETVYLYKKWQFLLSEDLNKDWKSRFVCLILSDSTD